MDGRGVQRLALRYVADPLVPSSLSYKARQRRQQLLLQHFPDLPDMTVLDLGGTFNTWTTLTNPPREVVIG